MTKTDGKIPRRLSFRTAGAAVFILLAFAAVYFLSDRIQKHRVNLPEGYEDSDLNLQGSKLKGFALGGEGLLADIYWMRSLQYIGDKMVKVADQDINLDDLTGLSPRLLYPYLDTATDLDPHFIAAYSYGATVLPAIDPRKAVELTEKGIRNNPDSWRLYQYLGYIYWKSNDFQKAAEIYKKGAQFPEAPPFMKMMAATMDTEGGSRSTAYAIYQGMLSEAIDEPTKNVARLRLKEIDAMNEMDAANSVLAEYQKQHGRCISGIAELLPMLSRIELPNGAEFRIDRSGNLVDPSDAPYILASEKCILKLDPQRSKLSIR